MTHIFLPELIAKLLTPTVNSSSNFSVEYFNSISNRVSVPVSVSVVTSLPSNVTVDQDDDDDDTYERREDRGKVTTTLAAEDFGSETSTAVMDRTNTPTRKKLKRHYRIDPNTDQRQLMKRRKVLKQVVQKEVEDEE